MRKLKVQISILISVPTAPDQSSWKNTVLAKGELRTEIDKLKRQPPHPIL